MHAGVLKVFDALSDVAHFGDAAHRTILIRYGRWLVGRTRVWTTTQTDDTSHQLYRNYDYNFRWMIVKREGARRRPANQIERKPRHAPNRQGDASKSTIRTLIEAAVVHGGDSRGGEHVRFELHGDLFRMLDFADSAAAMAGGSGFERRSPRRVGAGGLSRTWWLRG